MSDTDENVSDEKKPSNPDETKPSAEAGGAPSADATDDADRPTLDSQRPSQQRSEFPAEDTHPTGKSSEPAPSLISFEYYGHTDVGLVREHNEDNFIVANLDTELRGQPEGDIQEGLLGKRGLLLGVCDGMGGAAAGEVASQMAVDTLHEVLEEATPGESRDDFARLLVHSVEESGSRIFSAAKMDRTRRGMGTTSTVATLRDKVLFVGQVGDSRCYVLRNGELSLITKDQSLVNQLIEAGQLTEEEAEAFEHSNIILQALGTTEEVTVDLTFLELRRGDRILLCSDGLSGLVHASAIGEVMRESESIKDACHALIQMANSAGGHDNITCIICEFTGAGLASGEDAPLAAYQQYPLPERADDAANHQGGREPSIRFDASKPGADVKRVFGPPSTPGVGGGSSRASQVPWGIIAASAIVLALVLALTMGREPEIPRPAPAPSRPSLIAEVELVEVTVTADVEMAELFVDDEPRGPITDGQSLHLELEPGVHEIEARDGVKVLSVVSLHVRLNHPTDVRLSAPAPAPEVPLTPPEPRVDEPTPDSPTPTPVPTVAPLPAPSLAPSADEGNATEPEVQPEPTAPPTEGAIELAPAPPAP